MSISNTECPALSLWMKLCRCNDEVKMIIYQYDLTCLINEYISVICAIMELVVFYFVRSSFIFYLKTKIFLCLFEELPCIDEIDYWVGGNFFGSIKFSSTSKIYYIYRQKIQNHPIFVQFSLMSLAYKNNWIWLACLLF